MKTTLLDPRVRPGMVWKHNPDINGNLNESEYVVYGIMDNTIFSQNIATGGRHVSGSAWFRKGSFRFVRQMRDKELRETVNCI